MASYPFLPDANGGTKRPELLSVLGLFTFINAGSFLFIYAFGLLGMLAIGRMPVDEFAQMMHESAGRFLQEDQMFLVEEMSRVLHANGVVLMLIYLLRTAARLAGAIGIWRARKTGFYLYAGAQLVGLFAPHLVLPWGFLGVFGPLMTVAVTAIYGSQLNRLA